MHRKSRVVGAHFDIRATYLSCGAVCVLLNRGPSWQHGARPQPVDPADEGLVGNGRHFRSGSHLAVNGQCESRPESGVKQSKSARKSAFRPKLPVAERPQGRQGVATSRLSLPLNSDRTVAHRDAGGGSCTLYQKRSFVAALDIQNQVIRWPRRGCGSLGGGTVVKLPRNLRLFEDYRIKQQIVDVQKKTPPASAE
jgi:hypothetical protein